MKAQKCIWRCGSLTSNRSRICDHCWAYREEIYRGRKAKEAIRKTKPLTPAQREALRKATTMRRAKLTQEMPQSGGVKETRSENATWAPHSKRGIAQRRLWSSRRRASRQ